MNRNIYHEYETTKEIDHDSILKVIKIKNDHYEYEPFSGVSLNTLLSDHCITILQALNIGIKLIQLLGVIHDRAIIHKNIHPNVVLFDYVTDQLKLSGFSYATKFSYKSNWSFAVETIEGDLNYISPEQTGRMNRGVDYRSDFYSFGIFLYKMATGTLPFISTDPLELIYRHLATQPKSPRQINPDIPDIVSQVVLKCLEKDASYRYQSAYGIEQDLKRCLNAMINETPTHTFTIAQHDISQQFLIPQTLYGREDEIQDILDQFQCCSEGNSQLLLLSGYSGIGKTSLVKEVYTPITEKKGFFISGKFDQYKKNTPYLAFIEAFQTLINMLLLQDKQQLKNWKEKLEQSLGINGQVIVDVIPELKLIIGKQHPIQELGSLETQNRFNETFKRFISVFAKTAHPLVIFLDDLQWTDYASLELLYTILTDQSLTNILLIGAYRDNEVDKTHRLHTSILKYQKEKLNLHHIKLKALQNDDIACLLSDCLSLEKRDCEELVHVVTQKTAGNPFFINQLLIWLYQNKMIQFNVSQGKWDLDIDTIKTSDITDNVVDLLTHKIKTIPKNLQVVLSTSSCLGKAFLLDILAHVINQDPYTLLNSILDLVQMQLLYADCTYSDLLYIQQQLKNNQAVEKMPTFTFIHDKVQQASYELLNNIQKKESHYRAGCYLKTINTENNYYLFEIVTHLNESQSLINTHTEYSELAQFNFQAGVRAKLSNSYQTATNFFEQGLTLLGDNIWETHPEFAFKLYLELAAAYHLSGQTEIAEDKFKIILSQIKDTQKLVYTHSIQMELYTNIGRPDLAISIGKKALSLLGIKLPKKERKYHVLLEVMKVKWLLKNKKPDFFLTLPQTNDQKILDTMMIMNLMVAPSYQVGSDLFAISILKMAQLSISNGNSEYSPFAYMTYANVAGAILGDYQFGYQLGQVSMELNNKIGNVALEPKLRFVYGMLLSPWKKHIRDEFDCLHKGVEKGIELGDFAYAGFCAFSIVIYTLLKGDPLSNSLFQFSQYQHLRDMDQTAFYYMTTAERVVLALQGKTTGLTCFSSDTFSDDDYRQKIEGSLTMPPLCWYYVSRMMLNYMAKKYTTVVEISEKCLPILEVALGMFWFAEFFYYKAIALTALAIDNQHNAKEKRNYVKQVKKIYKKISNWATHCPYNFLHKKRLIEAELAVINNQFQNAIFLYNEAISCAKKQGFTQDEAIANERASHFLIQHNCPKLAVSYYQESMTKYTLWGAMAKVALMEESYDTLFPDIPRDIISKTGVVTDTLDTQTVLKSSQIISSEIELKKLIANLIDYALKNAGAEKGVLFRLKDDQWFVNAEKNKDKSIIHIESPIDLDRYNQYSKSIFQYVINKKQPIVIGNATEDILFNTDPHVIKNKILSVLCLPLLKQNNLVAILYLENNLTTDVFTENRVELLKIIASQAAISIENATLYETLQTLNKTLEDRVEKEVSENKRMWKISEKISRQSTLSRMNMGISHEINNPLSILETESFSLLEELKKGQLQPHHFSTISKEIGCSASLIFNELVIQNHIDQTGIFLELCDLDHPDFDLNLKSVPLKYYPDILEIMNKEFILTKSRRFAKLINENVHRISSIIKTMKEFGSEKEKSQMIKLDPSHIIQDLKQLFGLEEKHNYIKINYDIDTQKLAILGNKGRLEQVFLNLYKNSITAMRSTVNTTNIFSIIMKSGTFKNTEGKVIPAVKFQVSDTGCGIPSDKIKQVFDPYFSTKGGAVGDNIGLGLAIASKIIYDHQGMISVESILNQSTTFTIYLPIIDP